MSNITITNLNTMQLLDELAELAHKSIAQYRTILNDIELCKDLHRFGKNGDFDVEFLAELNWLLETWTDDGTTELFDAHRVADIEDKLERIPFERAVQYKEPTNSEIANVCLSSSTAEWRTEVASVMTMSNEDKIRIFGYFEYMCYFVINARDELLFDIVVFPYLRGTSKVAEL